MADKGSSPKPQMSATPIITLARPSVSPPTLSPTQGSTATTAATATTPVMSVPTATSTTSAATASSMSPISTSTSTPAVAAAAAMSGAKKALDINSLMSPPEPMPLDSFSPCLPDGSSQSQAPPNPQCDSDTVSKAQEPMSPPVSPFNKAEPTPRPAGLEAPAPGGDPVKDPILFPAREGSPSPPQAPLFEPTDTRMDDAEVVVDAHIKSRPPIMFSVITPPDPNHYKLAMVFQSKMMNTVFRSPESSRAWLRNNKLQLALDRQAVRKAKAAREVKTAKKRPTQLPALSPRPAVHTLTSAPSSQSIKPPRGPRTDKVVKLAAHKTTSASISRHVRPQTTPRKVFRTSATPEPGKRQTQPSREDKKFDELPDYCPPLESLPPRANCLKVDWKGTPLDLTADPHSSKLHPEELSMASHLRLDCATYLTSKRRFFMRRLECAKVGKEFRKTDAQQACKIDVNKASKLWTAFEKVGWLDVAWMDKFMV